MKLPRIIFPITVLLQFLLHANAFTSSPTTYKQMARSPSTGRLFASDEFWQQQRALVNEMSSMERSAKAAQKEKFAKRRGALVSDTANFSFLIFCLLWAGFENPFVPISYSLGALMSLAYAYGLGKYVETLGKNPTEASEPGEGFGQARFGFLIILFLVVNKFQYLGLIPLPAVSGFFTYKLASISQGLKEFDD